MSRTKRLKHVATRTIYHRGTYFHGEFIGVAIAMFFLAFFAYITAAPSIHADYNVFNQSTGDVSVNYSIDQKPSFVVETNGFNGKVSTTVTTIDGRTAARERGTLPFLEPGESRDYDLQFDTCTL